MFLIITAFILICANINNVFSQYFYKPKISAGIITTDILGDNRAKLPMVATSDEDDAYTGVILVFTHPNIAIRAILPTDQYETLKLTGGIDYVLFSGRERIVVNRNIVHLLRHDVNMLAVVGGADYVLAELGFANAKIYTGAELKLNYFHSIKAERYENYLRDNERDNTYIHPSKSEALRLGGVIKFGVEGRIRNRFYVNTGVALGIINAVGRDDSRGELLTPLKLLENAESPVSTFQVIILLQYTL